MYRHSRLDNNQPFYVGIGNKRNCKDNWKSEYKRAYLSGKSAKRSEFWHRTANKYGYYVEILFESDDLISIKKKEIEFIQLYGRRDAKTGILVNLTDGGDGLFNATRETLSRMIERSKSRNNENHILSKPVFQYDISGNFIAQYTCMRRASEAINAKPSHISNCCKQVKGVKTVKGFRWFFDFLGDKIDPYNVNSYRRCKYKKVGMYDLNTGMLLNVFDKIRDVKTIGLSEDAVSAALQRKPPNQSQGFGWKYH